jgi:hypothetical protein
MVMPTVNVSLSDEDYEELKGSKNRSARLRELLADRRARMGSKTKAEFDTEASTGTLRWDGDKYSVRRWKKRTEKR